MSPPHDLTPSQWKAVDHFKGPLLVLAGPGSGKTRVITHRIARLVDKGVNPQEILAITFTNKAAGEMDLRVKELVPERRIWVSTFHRFCARLLRQWGETVGLQSNFSIFDMTDQRQLLRDVLRDLDIDAVSFGPAKIVQHISRAKNNLQSADDVARSFENAIGNHLQAVVARVYPEYQKRLLESNAVDFDDLLLHVVTLLSENPELRRDLDERHRYVLVDEYQDTNAAQYRIVAALSQDHPNLCVTGDPDQSIYGWRGARLDNILRFESDYPDAAVVRLEQNFRSTGQILRTADGLIAHNLRRKQKSLITDNPDGDPVELVIYRDGRHEAASIAGEIRRLVEAGERSWSDFAVFYRVNALTREIETALLQHRVPYQVAAGLEFYERAEIKDMLAYLKLIQNPDDRIAFCRVVNRPRRGIGKKTISKLTAWADANRANLLAAAAQSDNIPTLPKKAAKTLKSFAETIADFTSLATGSVAELLSKVIHQTGYIEAWQDRDLEQDQQRLANVQELGTAARQYDLALGDEATLEGFLETTSLVSAGDNLDESAGRVTLMTLHAAKGLEFPVVYLIALEQNLIPHERSFHSDDDRDLEEERRLLFVGITRAQQRLFLSQTLRRDFRGRDLSTIPSDFLWELEVTVVDRSIDSWGPSSTVHRDPNDEAETIDADAGPDDEASQEEPPMTNGWELHRRMSDAGASTAGFAVGMSVRHPQYGLGTVIRVSGSAQKQMISVAFEEGQEAKSFVATKSALQPVGVR